MEINKCIRVLADPVQIKECKESIREIQNPLADISQVLSLAGNQVRLKILYLLYKESEMCPCDLSDVLDMTVPAISQHLRKLKDRKIVQDKKVGQTIFYSLNKEAASPILPIIKSLKSNIKETVS